MSREFWAKQSAWSQETFGADQERGPLGALKHLRKEVQEAIDSYESGELDELQIEIVDCLFLTFDAARRSGLSYDEFIAKAFDKLKINKGRTWRKPGAGDEPIEHDRSLD